MLEKNGEKLLSLLAFPGGRQAASGTESASTREKARLKKRRIEAISNSFIVIAETPMEEYQVISLTHTHTNKLQTSLLIKIKKERGEVWST